MCQWVLALSFQCISKSQKFFLRDTLCRYHIRYFRFPACDGSGLIQSYDLHFTGLFQRYRRLEHDSVLCAHSVTNHNGNRCGKSQCTRAADDQYGYTSCKRVAESLSGKQPYDRRNYRDQDNHRYKYTGNFICNLRNRRFCRSRIADHLNDLRKCGIFPNSGCLAFEETGLIHGCCRYLVTFCFVNRNTLSGKCCFIDCTGSFQHDTVYRYIFTRSYYKDIAFFHLVDGNLCLHTIFQDNSCLRSQLHQTL